VSTTSFVLPGELDRRYRVVVRGDGVWLEDSTGKRYLDAMSGGSVAATPGHGRPDLIDAARRQAKQLTYVHNERLTNPWQERLAQELVEVAPDGFTRVRFVTGGAEANELALKLARSYHVERGDSQRWQVIPPSTRHFDPSGEEALAALDRALEEAGPENVSAFFMERISAAALPAYTPPVHFWERPLPRDSAPATPRSARCSASSTSTTPSRKGRASSRSVTPGTARRSHARWDSPCSM
jgi:adenosylmethionine-8-amino-7-oxononanoate aminotransferase